MSDFVPRTTSAGMYPSRYWYGDNPFYTSGYGLPNCTAYAWGRAYEISNIRPALPLYDAGDWYTSVDTAIYQRGQIPRLGAIACWDEPSDPDGVGHVAVVERIDSTGVYMSESRYRRPISDYPPDTEHYFDFTKWDDRTKLLTWMYSGFRFLGFIYNPYTPTPHSTIPIWLLFKMKQRRDGK